MATYKQIHGTKIEAVASDPSNPVEGQVWYNTTSNVLKGQILSASGAWATGGNLGTARYVPGGGGSQTAGIMFGGQPGSGTSASQTELYDGTTWTEVGDLNTARERPSPAAITNTAALCVCGVVYPGATNKNLNESWNGSSWTEVADTNITHNGRFGFGTPSAAIVAGGGTPGMNETESWNGSSWTEVSDLNTGRKDNEAGGAGTSTAGIVTGGNNGSVYDNTETWNGSAWTEVADLNTARSGASQSGTQTASIFSGGTPPIKSNVELWNGSTWSEDTDLPTGKRNHAGSKVTGSTSALVFGGIAPSPGALSQTLEWNGAGASLTRTFTDS